MCWINISQITSFWEWLIAFTVLAEWSFLQMSQIWVLLDHLLSGCFPVKEFKQSKISTKYTRLRAKRDGEGPSQEGWKNWRKWEKVKWFIEFLKRQSFANIKAFADILCWWDMGEIFTLTVSAELMGVKSANICPTVSTYTLRTIHSLVINFITGCHLMNLKKNTQILNT